MTTKLLAVDDSKTMRKVLEITFAGNTYDSTIVGSADEALASLRSNPPQLAVVDGYLAGESGYDLCQKIKEASPTTKVVLLSSKQRPFDAGKAAAVGVDDHFDKPFDSTKFLDKLSQLDLGTAPGAGTSPAAAAVSPKMPPAAAPRPAAAPPPLASSSPASKAAAGASVAASRATAPRPASLSAATSPGLSPQPPAASKAPAPAPAKPIASPIARPTPPIASSSASAASSRDAETAVAEGMTERLHGMGLTPEQVAGVLSLSKEVVEQVVWEVVPQLAETMIKEEIARLTAE